MKYKLLIIFIFITSCASNISNNRNVKTYESKGFAYIYNEADYSNKLISTKVDNTQMLVYHNNLKKGSIVKLLNPDNKKSVILKVAKKSKYPEFYKIMITETVANKLSLSLEIPFIEIQEIKKNKSFVAKKAKTFNEEKKISNTAPVTKVKIDNISTIKKSKSKKIKKFAIIIGEFSSIDSVNLLKKRLIINFNAKTQHLDGKSADQKFAFQMKCEKSWHHAWAGFYYYKKHFGYIFALKKSLPFAILNLIKYICFLIVRDKKKSEIYKLFLLGFIYSLLNKKASYRAEID